MLFFPGGREAEITKASNESDRPEEEEEEEEEAIPKPIMGRGDLITLFFCRPRTLWGVFLAEMPPGQTQESANRVLFDLSRYSKMHFFYAMTVKMAPSAHEWFGI